MLLDVQTAWKPRKTIARLANARDVDEYEDAVVRKSEISAKVGLGNPDLASVFNEEKIA